MLFIYIITRQAETTWTVGIVFVYGLVLKLYFYLTLIINGFSFQCK